jgi:alpha-amylase
MGVMMQAFYWDCPQIEGIPFGWWAHLRLKVPELAATGFTALWLPPASKAANNTSMGYDRGDDFRVGSLTQLRRTRATLLLCSCAVELE